MKRIHGTNNYSSEGKMNSVKRVFARTNTFVDVSKIIKTTASNIRDFEEIGTKKLRR